jgi:hypothetical protein
MKRSMITLIAVAAVFALATPAYAVSAVNGVVFNSVPDTLPGNVPAYGFQATRMSEFGDGISFNASAKKHLKNVKVVMSVWACQTGQWNLGDCATTAGSTFTHPITFNIYAAETTGSLIPGALIATLTQTFTLKFRPSVDPTCPNNPTVPTGWFSAADGKCQNGLAQKITFNFASQHLVLPNSIVYGVAFNTTSWGAAPYGTSTACFNDAVTGCAYDALNVGAAAGFAKRGTDRYPNGQFANVANPGYYCDGGTGGSSIFRLDDAFGCSTGFNPLVRFLNQK